jgi:hypothetical protein
MCNKFLFFCKKERKYFAWELLNQPEEDKNCVCWSHIIHRLYSIDLYVNKLTFNQCEYAEEIKATQWPEYEEGQR